MQANNSKFPVQIQKHPEFVYCSYFSQIDCSLYLALNIGILKTIISYRNLPEGIEIKGAYENYLQKAKNSASLQTVKEIATFIDHYKYIMDLQSQIDAFTYINSLFISRIQMYNCTIKTFERIIHECCLEYLKNLSAIEEKQLLVMLSKVFKVAFTIIDTNLGRKNMYYDHEIKKCPNVILYKAENESYGLLYTADMCEFELNTSRFENILYCPPYLFKKIIHKNEKNEKDSIVSSASMQSLPESKIFNKNTSSSLYRTLNSSKEKRYSIPFIEARASISKPPPLNLIKTNKTIYYDDSDSSQKSLNITNKNPDPTFYSMNNDHSNKPTYENNTYSYSNQALFENSYRSENSYVSTTLNSQEYNNLEITSSTINNPPSFPLEPITIEPRVEESQSIAVEEHKVNTPQIISEERIIQRRVSKCIFKDNAQVLTCCESGCTKFSKYFCTCTGYYYGFCSKHIKLHSKKGRISHPRVNNFTEIDKESKHQIISLCEERLKSINKMKKNILKITQEKERKLLMECKNDIEVLENKKKLLKEVKNYAISHNKIMHREKYNEVENFMLDCIETENEVIEIYNENEIGKDILTVKNEESEKNMLELIEAMGHAILNSQVRQESLILVIKKVMEKDKRLAESEVLKRFLE